MRAHGQDWQEMLDYARNKAKRIGSLNPEHVAQDAVGDLFFRLSGKTKPPRMIKLELCRLIRRAARNDSTQLSEGERRQRQIDRLEDRLETLDNGSEDESRFIQHRLNMIRFGIAANDINQAQGLNKAAIVQQCSPLRTPGFLKPWDGTLTDLYGPVIVIDPTDLFGTD
jgi:hypothetical protein